MLAKVPMVAVEKVKQHILIICGDLMNALAVFAEDPYPFKIS